MSVIVTGHIYTDRACTKPLSTPIGPFVDKPAAFRFMAGLAPLWGSYLVETLTPGATARIEAGR